MDKGEVEIPKQPPVVGLDDSVHLHHDAVGCQLLRHHERQPDLVVKGPRGEDEAHTVVWLDGLGELVDDVFNTHECSELWLGIRVLGAYKEILGDMTYLARHGAMSAATTCKSGYAPAD